MDKPGNPAKFLTDGVMRLSAAQLAAWLDGLDWSRMHVPRLGRPKTAQ